MNFKRRSVALLCSSAVAALAAVVAVGCAGFGAAATVTLHADDIQALLQKSFPRERRLLDAVDVSIAAPRTRLLPDSNRIGAVLDVQARERIFGGSWSGRLDFDAALRWDAAEQSVRLTQVRVQDLMLTSAGNATRSSTERLGAAVAERMLEDLSLYRLKPERAAQLQQKGYAPSAVTVTSRGVEITFEAVKR